MYFSVYIYFEFGMFVDTKTNDIISMFKIECLCSVFWVTHDTSSCCVVDYVTVRKVMDIVPGVKAPVAMDVV